MSQTKSELRQITDVTDDRIEIFASLEIIFIQDDDAKADIFKEISGSVLMT